MSNTKELSVKTWEGSEVEKKAFHGQAKRMLTEINRELDLNADIRANLAGPASLGEVTLHGEFVYVTLGGLHPDRALIRSCRGKQDYCGGTNQYSPTDKESMIKLIRAVIKHQKAVA